MARPVRSPRETGPDGCCRRPMGRSATPRDRPTHPPTGPGSPPVPATPTFRVVPVAPRTRNHLTPAHGSLPGSAHPPPGTFQLHRSVPRPRDVSGNHSSRLRRVRCDPSSIRQPVAGRPAPISPGRLPPARPVSGSSVPSRPTHAAQTLAPRYRIRRCLPRRLRAAAPPAGAPASTTTGTQWPGRSARCPAHLRSPRRARHPGPQRRWLRAERA